MILADTATYISIPIILGIVFWVTRTRVDTKTCDRTHAAVDAEHKNLRDYIKDTEERQEKRHGELVSLIKNGGQSEPRVQT